MKQPLDSRPRAIALVARTASPVLLALGLLALALALGALLTPRIAEAKRIKVLASDLPREPAAAESLAYSIDELPYRVAPGDLLNVDYGVVLDGVPQRTLGLLVRPDGMITLNTIGDVRAGGLTTTELDSVLQQEYATIYREPKVTIAVAKLAGNFVHVLGEVRQPGSYELTPNATVLQAIAHAGGELSTASMGNVILMRRTGPTSMVARKVQSNRAIKQGLASQDPYVRRFDIVYVPKTTIANLDQFVDQHITKLLSVPQGYIFGWQAFHIDRLFPRDVRVQP
jgi:polysaccharide export outer membrane protein